jgi:hypothetical protein
MKSLCTLAGFALLLALSAGVIAAEPAKAEKVKSGPQAGEKLAGPFHPLNINGDKAGQKNCLYCANGQNPVAMVFARDANPQVVKLIKRLDETTVKNEGASMGSFFVFLSDKEGLDKELTKVVEANKLKKCVLSIDNPAGPKGYNVSQDADVTVVLYVGGTAKVNHAFAKGQLTDKDIDAIVADVAKILPNK